MNGSEYLVMINVPPILEEAIVDCLLSFEYSDGFSSYEINAHTENHQHFSLREQVSGRQRLIRFQIHVHSSNVEQLLKSLKADFSGSNLSYWIVPMIENGCI